MSALYRLVLVFALMLTGCGEPPSQYHAIDVYWQHTRADFALVDSDGKPRRLADFRGKVVVLFFGYTHCPEVCPTTMADLTQVMKQLGQDAERVQVLFVTLDPERDKPAMLARYVSSFNPSFLGLYGDAQATASAAKSFGVNFEKQADKQGGYTLDHSDGIYLLGPRGKPLLVAPYGQRTDLMVKDIRSLLVIGR